MEHNKFTEAEKRLLSMSMSPVPMPEFDMGGLEGGNQDNADNPKIDDLKIDSSSLDDVDSPKEATETSTELSKEELKKAIDEAAKSLKTLGPVVELGAAITFPTITAIFKATVDAAKKADFFDGGMDDAVAVVDKATEESTDEPDAGPSEGSTESAEEGKETPAMTEMKEHFGDRYESMSEEQREAVMKVIEGLDPKQAEAYIEAQKILTPAEREIYAKAGPKIANRLSQLSPEDVSLYFQSVMESDPKKLYEIHSKMSPEAIAVIRADEVNYTKEEYDVWNKLHNEYDRLLSVNEGSEGSESNEGNEAFGDIAKMLVELFKQILTALGVEGFGDDQDDEADNAKEGGDEVSDDPKEQAEALKKGLPEKEGRLKELDTKVAEQEGSVADLQTKIDGMDPGQDKEDAKTKLEGLTTKLNELKEKQKDLKQEIEDDKKKITALENAGEGESVLTEDEKGSAKETVEGAIGTALAALEAAFPGIDVKGLREALGGFTPDELNIDGKAMKVLKLGEPKGILHELFPEGTEYITEDGLKKAILDLKDNPDKMAKIADMVKAFLPKKKDKPDDKGPEKPDDKAPDKPGDKGPDVPVPGQPLASVPSENTDKPAEVTPKSVELSAEFIQKIALAKEGLSASMDQAVGSIQRRVDMYRAHVKGTQADIDDLSYLNPFNMGLRSRLKSTLASEKSSLESAQNAMSKIVSARDQVQAIVNDTDNTKTGKERMQDIKDGVKLVEGIRGMVKDTDYAKIGESLRELDANLGLAENLLVAPIAIVTTPVALLAELGSDAWEMGSEQLAALGEWSGPQWDAFVEGAEFYGNYVVDGLVDTTALVGSLGAEGMQMLVDGSDFLIEEGGQLIDLATTEGTAYVEARIKEGKIIADDFAQKGAAAMNTIVGLGLYAGDVIGDVYDSAVDSIADFIQPGMEWGDEVVADAMDWGADKWEDAMDTADMMADGAVTLVALTKIMGEAAVDQMLAEVDHYMKIGGKIVDVATDGGRDLLIGAIDSGEVAVDWVVDGVVDTGKMGLALGVAVGDASMNALIDQWDGVVTIGNSVVQLYVVSDAKLKELVEDAGDALDGLTKESRMIQKELERRGSEYTGLKTEKSDEDTG